MNTYSLLYFGHFFLLYFPVLNIGGVWPPTGIALHCCYLSMGLTSFTILSLASGASVTWAILLPKFTNDSYIRMTWGSCISVVKGHYSDSLVLGSVPPVCLSVYRRRRVAEYCCQVEKRCQVDFLPYTAWVYRQYSFHRPPLAASASF